MRVLERSAPPPHPSIPFGIPPLAFFEQVMHNYRMATHSYRDILHIYVGQALHLSTAPAATTPILCLDALSPTVRLLTNFWIREPQSV